MVKFVSYHGKTYRLLLETAEGVAWIIDWENPGAPIKVGDKNELFDEPIPGEFMDESVPSKKRTAAMEKRLRMIQPLTENKRLIFDTKFRRETIAALAQALSVSEKTLTRFFYAYLAKGKEGLLPAQRTATQKQKDDAYIDADMQKAINKYYYSPKKLSVRGAYEMYLIDYWKDENGQLKLDHPDFTRFQRNYRRVRSNYKKIISRQGIGEYQKNYRPLLGYAGDNAQNCGYFEMDATEADICIVSKYSRKPIGRPIVYLAVDVATRLVTGVYVGLSGGSNAILQCLQSMVEDKVLFCQERGIEITASQWPSVGLPRVISTDRGKDFMSGRVRELCERFDIEITNLPAYRPDLKGCVERTFACLQERYKPMLRGYGTIEIENTREGAAPVQTKACLDLGEYTRILLRCIIYHNSSRVLLMQREPQMIADGVKPISSCLWEWMVKNGRADLINANAEDVSLMLLPRGNASITRQGLMFDGLRYDAENVDMTKEYVNAGISGRKKVVVAYREDSSEAIYLIREGKYIKFVLTSASQVFSGLSFEEIHLMKKEEQEVRKEAERKQSRDAAMCADYILETVQNAEKTEPHTLKEVTRERMSQEREREKINGKNS